MPRGNGLFVLFNRFSLFFDKFVRIRFQKTVGCQNLRNAEKRHQNGYFYKYAQVLGSGWVYRCCVPNKNDAEMTDLIPTINEIVKYGLTPNLTIPSRDERDKLLEKSLVKFYSLYFDIEYEFDETDYPDFDKQKTPNIRQNIASNFSDFGLYKTIIDFNDFDNKVKDGIGDAIDDLTDITLDLLEIKWRIENNSLADGLWFFELNFYSHTQQHILDLLNYMKQKNG